jgi:hypothetical protein
VTVVKSGGSFVAQPNSLITKCPSKFAAAPAGSVSASPGG